MKKTGEAELSDIQEWVFHLDLHVTEHDLSHAGKALRSAWPQVKKYFLDELQKQKAENSALIRIINEYGTRTMRLDKDNGDALDLLEEAYNQRDRERIEMIKLRAEYDSALKALVHSEFYAKSEYERAESLETDALRYRWLRSWNRVGTHMVCAWRHGEGKYESLPQESALDAAIDAARKGE